LENEYHVTRVLYFSRDYTPHDYRFLEALAKTEYRIAYLQLESRKPSLEQRHLPKNVQQIDWAGGRGTVGFEELTDLVGDLERVIGEWQPDLIHAGSIQTAAYLSALTGFQPLVSMSWGYDLLREAGRSPELERATRFTLQNSTVMVGDCQVVREKATGYGMPAERIVTFPWGVDLDEFSPGSAVAHSEQVFTLLSTRSWEPLYGVDILAQAFVIAAQACPQLRLFLLGSGSMVSQLQSLFEEAGVSDRVRFPGQVGQAGLPGYYRSADLYISASHIDGSSVSLLEALACSLPALVSDIPGNREWIEPGVQGWLFPDGYVDALAQGILHAFDERRRLARMGQAARRLAEARADWNRNFKELIRAYELALAFVTETVRSSGR
jgi:glycosyltransferase involved in cell wall biosynthesis